MASPEDAASAHAKVVAAKLASWIGETPQLLQSAVNLVELGCDTPEMLTEVTEEDLIAAGFNKLQAGKIARCAAAAFSTDVLPTSPASEAAAAEEKQLAGVVGGKLRLNESRQKGRGAHGVVFEGQQRR